MAFSQAGIIGVRVAPDGTDLFVAWSSSAPVGTTYQVYVDRRLAWYGSSTRCHIPIPAVESGRNIWVEVGVVDAGEPTRDYSSSLVAPGGRSERAQLSWAGGTYLDPTGRDDIQGYRIYQGLAPGQPVATTSAVDSVVAYPGGWINDGFGKGGLGGGGFGRSGTLYEWRSRPLASGVWRFAVIPFDKAGNARGVGQVASVTINAAPRAPAQGSGGARLTATYSGPSDRRLTLHWLSSPSDLR